MAENVLDFEYSLTFFRDVTFAPGELNTLRIHSVTIKTWQWNYVTTHIQLCGSFTINIYIYVSPQCFIELSACLPPSKYLNTCLATSTIQLPFTIDTTPREYIHGVLLPFYHQHLFLFYHSHTVIDLYCLYRDCPYTYPTLTHTFQNNTLHIAPNVPIFKSAKPIHVPKQQHDD